MKRHKPIYGVGQGEGRTGRRARGRSARGRSTGVSFGTSRGGSSPRLLSKRMEAENELRCLSQSNGECRDPSSRLWYNVCFLFIVRRLLLWASRGMWGLSAYMLANTKKEEKTRNSSNSCNVMYKTTCKK